MSPYEITLIVLIIFIRFSDAEAAWTAALHEVLRAATSRDEAEAVRAEVGASLPLADAVLAYATRRGEVWLPFDRAFPAHDAHRVEDRTTTSSSPQGIG